MSTTTRFFHLPPLSPARARLEEAEHYFLAGNLNEALAAAQQAWREHPQQPEVFRVLAYIHMARGEYPPAAQAAYQSVVLDGDNAASFATLAQVYVTFNMLPLAEETLTTATQRFPDDAALAVLLADVQFRRGRDKVAAQMATEALAKNPQDGYAQALLGAYHVRGKRYSEAASLLAAAVAVYPQRWDYLRDYGIALLYIGRYSAAREALAASFRLNPADAAAKQHLFLALKLEDGRMREYWDLALFWMRHSGWGWLLNITGMLTALAGCIWGGVVAYNWNPGALFDLAWPLALLFGGGALIYLTAAGLRLRGRKGKRFDSRLWRMVEGRAAGG